MDSPDDLLALVGTRVSARRSALSLTLDALAERTGVSRAMISRVERGEVHASAVVLDRLCGGLGLTLSELFARETATPLLRRAEQPVWRDPATGYVRREVAPAFGASGTRIVAVDLPPGAEVAFGPDRDRGVSQFVWLLEGRLELDVAGTTHQLEAGDCLAMRITGNTFRNPGQTPARYAVVLVPEGRS